MLEFIYGFDYDAGPTPEHEEKLQWVRRIGLHVEVCLTANKFGIPGLEQNARVRTNYAATHLL